MNIKPVFTEKSLKMAAEGKYSFWVPMDETKVSLKSKIAKIFGVKVVDIKTVTSPGESRRNARGIRVKTMPRKKAIVSLKDGDKIDIFEQSK